MVINNPHTIRVGDRVRLKPKTLEQFIEIFKLIEPEETQLSYTFRYKSLIGKEWKVIEINKDYIHMILTNRENNLVYKNTAQLMCKIKDGSK